MATDISQAKHTLSWWIFLLEGLVSILLGVLVLTAPGATLVALVIPLGLYWLISGVLEWVRMFVERRAHRIWSLLVGVLGIVAAILVLNQPLFSTLIRPTPLVIYVGVLGVLIGVIHIINGFKGGGTGSFCLGIISLGLGSQLWVSSPQAVLVFGTMLLTGGLPLIIWAFHVRRLAQVR